MKKFLNRIVAFLKSIFTDFDAFLETHVTPSIELTKRLISILESPVANIITALIPGDADDKLKDFLLNYLHKAIDALYITADIANEPNWTLKVYKTIKYLESLSPEMRQDILRGIARNLIKQSVIASGDSLPKDKIINGLLETKLIQLGTSLDVINSLPNEIIVNGDLQVTPVVETVAPVLEAATPVVVPPVVETVTPVVEAPTPVVVPPVVETVTPVVEAAAPVVVPPVVETVTPVVEATTE